MNFDCPDVTRLVADIIISGTAVLASWSLFTVITLETFQPFSAVIICITVTTALGEVLLPV